MDETIFDSLCEVTKEQTRYTVEFDLAELLSRWLLCNCTPWYEMAMDNTTSMGLMADGSPLKAGGCSRTRRGYAAAASVVATIFLVVTR